MRNKDHIEELEELIGTPHDLQGSIIDNVVNTNQSLQGQGLDNKFTGFEQGGFNQSGVKIDAPDLVRTKVPIYCNSGDLISVNTDTVVDTIGVWFFNGNSFISVEALSTTSGIVTAPTNATNYYITLYVDSGVTPSTAGNVWTYVNNKIDEVKESIQTLDIVIDTAGLSYFVTNYNKNVVRMMVATTDASDTVQVSRCTITSTGDWAIIFTGEYNGVVRLLLIK